MQTMRSRLDTITRTAMEVSTLNLSATQKLSCVKSQTNNYWSFMSDFFDIVWNSWLFSWLSDIDVLTQGTKKLYIVISCDSGICWSLNRKLFSKVKNLVDDNTDLFCIWKKSFNFFVDQWFNVVWCVNNCQNSSDLEILNQYLWNSINLWIYSEIVVYYHTNWVVSKFDLYSFTGDELQWFFKKFKIDVNFGKSCNDSICQMDEAMFKKTMIIQLSQYIIYGAWLSTKYVEYSHCRLVSQKVSNNNFVRKCILSFNQNRQTLLTQKVLELMSMEYTMS